MQKVQLHVSNLQTDFFSLSLSTWGSLISFNYVISSHGNDLVTCSPQGQQSMKQYPKWTPILVHVATVAKRS